MPVIEGASNFTISGDARLYEIHGNAVINHLTDSSKAKNVRSIMKFPRVQASHKDYETSKKSGLCFPGTRKALLREMMKWTNKPSEYRMYVLSGLAGIGKSTVAYTVANQADELGNLGASFFFSRDEDDRNNAKRFFCTIAYQLCVYNETFAKAIGNVLLTERGSAATTKDPQDQLQTLILDPLRSNVQSRARPILVVVDALDECDEDDGRVVVKGLSQLVCELPSFKVILTTRPQPHLNRFFCSQGGRRIFHLQDIEDKVVDGDIRLYLKHSLSLEAVQERYPQRQWGASDEEIDSLVRAAGKLFIIASTAVRYILDKCTSNPAAQMQKLLHAFARYVTPFKDLDHFYTVILRNVVPENCDDYIVNRYQSVVGAIIFIQRPLPVSTLAHLINLDVVEIREVLNNLQSVILLGSDDVPCIYHKSFPDYLTDQVRCKDPCLRIDPMIYHTHIATCCFEIMDKHLKCNILGLGHPAQFMSNEDGLKEDRITDEQIQEKIPQQLRYACVYWVNHLEFADIEDADLVNIEGTDLVSGLERFADKHMLYWFEVLSLIGKLDVAHHAIGVGLKLLASSSSDLHQLLSDALRFISKFYDIIKRSALHTYYSALPFTPIDSLFYRRYDKEAVDNICTIEGGSEKWDDLVANLRHEVDKECVHLRISKFKFSLDSALFASCTAEYELHGIRMQGKSKIWDAATGRPISTISGHEFAVANDFSIVASSRDYITTLYNVNGSLSGTIFTASSKIQELALSSESSRVAAALSDGTVWLWDSGNAELIDSFDGFRGYQLEFSPTGTRLVYSLANGINLRSGISGKIIADLQSGSRHKFEVSGDGSRIVSVSSNCHLKLWNSENGALVGDVRNVGGDALAISANGSLLATADDDKVRLWNDHLAKLKVLELRFTWSLAFSLDNILAIATDSNIKLYNVTTHSFIHTILLSGRPSALAFSPDCTRLAVVGNHDVNLCDIRCIDTSGPPRASKGNVTTVTALALSRDSSRLACGFEDGRVELWWTSPTKRRIASLAIRSKMEDIFSRIFRQSHHTKSVRALAFNPDGRLFASGSDDGTIKLWDGGDGALRETLKLADPSITVQEVALSNNVLVATWGGRTYGDINLWSLDTLSYIHNFERDDEALKVSIAEDSTLIAVCLRLNPQTRGHVELLDVVNHTTIATFDVPSDIHTMTFLPDNSQLVVQSDEGVLLSFNLSNKRVITEPTLEHLVQLPNTPLWNGVPIWHCQDEDSRQHYLAALFPQHKSPVPVLWIPRQISMKVWTQGSSMIALGCEDGRVILLRLPTNHSR